MDETLPIRRKTLSNQSINKTKIMPIWDFSISLCLVGDIRRLHVLLSLHLVFPVVLGSKEENFLELFSLTLFADGLKKREASVTERQCRFTERSFWSSCKYWYSNKEIHNRWFNNMFKKIRILKMIFHLKITWNGLKIDSIQVYRLTQSFVLIYF